MEIGRTLSTLLVCPACETPSFAQLGWMRFDARIYENDIAAEGLPAIDAEEESATYKRSFNPSRTEGTKILHGSPLVFRSLLIVDGALSTKRNMLITRKADSAEARLSSGETVCKADAFLI